MGCTELSVYMREEGNFFTSWVAGSFWGAVLYGLVRITFECKLWKSAVHNVATRLLHPSSYCEQGLKSTPPCSVLLTCLSPLHWYRVVLCWCRHASRYGCWPRWPLPTYLFFFFVGTPSGRVFHFADDARTIKVILTTGKGDIRIYVHSEHCMELPAHTTSCRCQDTDLFSSKRSELLCGPSTGEFFTGT